MDAMFLGRPSWILSGSVVSWSEKLIPYFDVAIFLSLDNKERLKRIHQREVTRYGQAALAEGGSHHIDYLDFMAWNSAYEDPEFDGRNRTLHENWIKALPCPIIRLDSRHDIAALIKQTEAELSKI